MTFCRFVKYSGNKIVLDFSGNILRGDIGSKVALRLLREWIDLRNAELLEDWELARVGKNLMKITPLD